MTRHPRRAPRQGFALAVALFALVVIGALIAGVFFASTQEYRVGRNTLTQQRAFAAAEFGLNNAIAGWTGARYAPLAVGAVDSSTLNVTGGQARVKVTRLNAMSYWVMSEGVAGSGAMSESRRRTSAVVRLQIPEMNFLGALTLRGRARIGGSSTINGNDQNPAGWTDCPPAGDARPGLVVDSSSSISYSGSAYRIDGDPPVSIDRAARDTNTYFSYGESDWNDLVSSASLRLGSSGSTATFSRIAPDSVLLPTKRCRTELTSNWGSVRRTRPVPGICEGYYPIIHARGSLKITGGSGQGVLLVEEDLEVSGGFEFYGPVIVRGTLKTTGTGGHFNGGVMAANVDLDDISTVLGDAVVNYSQCAITSALVGTATPRLVAQRGWAELF